MLGSACLLVAAAALAAPQAPAKRGEVVVSDEAMAIHREALLIDGHNDLPWRLREKDDLSFRNIDLAKPQKGFHTDIPRLRKGSVGAQFWSAYVPSSTGQKGTAVRETLEQIDVIHRMVPAAIPTTFEMASRPTTSTASARPARSPR